MRYKEVKINEIIAGENYKIHNYIETEEFIKIFLKSKKQIACCPNCQNKCRIHGTYKRKIQDTPIHNKTVWLYTTAYEYKCENKECAINIFAEELEFAKKNQVMTDRLIQFIVCISIFMSNNSASMILELVGVKVSADTIKNLYDRINIVDNEDVEEIGIDDVAIRKGMKYATAIYDMRTHELIALLEGRDAESLKEWLKTHPKIKKVARDRASAFASAITEMLPECMQIADRFHLFENIIDYLRTYFYGVMPEKIYIKDNKILDNAPRQRRRLKYIVPDEELEKWNYDNTIPIDENNKRIIYDFKKHNLNSKQYLTQTKSRLRKYNDIKKIQKEINLSIEQLAEKYKYSTVTIKKYLKLKPEEVEKIKQRNDYTERKNKFDEYKNIIYKMLKDNRTLYEILNYLLYIGYDDDVHQLRDYIKILITNNFANLNPEDYSRLTLFKEEAYPKEEVVTITRAELLRDILTIDPDLKNKKLEKYLDIIEEKYPIVKEVKTIFKEYHSVIMGQDADRLDEFLQKYDKSIIQSLCEGIKKDIAAVKNAISSPISSGFVEGNNNKFKLIKRIVYGKMKLVNLFKKSFLAFSVNKESFNIFDLI